MCSGNAGWPFLGGWELNLYTPRDLEALETVRKEAWEHYTSMPLRKAQVPSGWKSETHQALRRPREAGQTPPGSSQEASQAGVGSILSLKLHRGRAICPLWEKRTHR